MPIYEYVCSNCDLKFELLRPLSQAEEGASCPQCQNTARRILSAFCSFTKDESGLSAPLGGNPCSSCSTTSCDTCSL